MNCGICITVGALTQAYTHTGTRVRALLAETHTEDMWESSNQVKWMRDAEVQRWILK